MKRNRILFALIVILAVLNVGLVYLHFFSNADANRHTDDSLHSWLDKNLSLSDDQEKKHVELRNGYFGELRKINDTLKFLKARFVSQSAHFELSDSLSNVWTDSINQWNRKADELTFRHVRNVRSILDTKQQPVWDSLIQVLMMRKGRR